MLIFYFLSAAQIFFETLPVSSSGHIILFQQMIGLITNDQFVKWLHVLHVPTALIVAIYFRKDWYKLVFSSSLVYLVRFMGLICIVDGITVLFFIMQPYVSIPLPLPLAFLLTAFILFSLRFAPSGHQTFNTPRAVLVGFVQGFVLLLPGVSRLAAVFVTLRWLGIPSRYAFMLAWTVLWPLMMVAGGAGWWSLYRDNSLHCFVSFPMMLVIVSTTLLSLLMMYFIGWLVKKNLLWWLSLYMLVPLILSLL